MDLNNPEPKHPKTFKTLREFRVQNVLSMHKIMRQGNGKFTYSDHGFN
jgi:hypothetical protein